MSDTAQGANWRQASDGKWYPPETPPPAPPVITATPAYQCPQCGHDMPPDQLGCGICGQVRILPVGEKMATAGRRLGQYLLDSLLAIVTLGIGWLIWSLIIWGRGQTPAMQILHIRVVKIETGKTATWGTMFLREFVGKFLIMGLISAVFFPAWVVLVFMLLWDKNRQELWDKVAGTIVVGPPETEPTPSPLPAAAIPDVEPSPQPSPTAQ